MDENFQPKFNGGKKGLIWEIFIVLDEDKEEAQKKQHEEHDKKRQQPEKVKIFISIFFTRV